MKRRIVLLTALTVILLAGSATAEMIAGLPLHVKKFEGGAIRVWLGDHISSTGIVAVPTEKGIVVIDTSGLPEVDRKLRKVIARELGRDDFKVLINTHEHGDHTGGNAVYADCTIVGHKLVAAGMNRSSGDRQRVQDWYATRITELENEIAALAADSPDRAPLREDLALRRLGLADLKEPTDPVPPTKTFSNRLELDLGDTTFELFYIGGMHSSSDIAILIPEQRLLLTGDTMADTWLTDTPGCLASFVVRSNVEHDFPKLLKNWNELLSRRGEFDHLLPGHWNGELSIDGFEHRVKYVQAMWDDAREFADSGQDLTALLSAAQFAERFPQLVNSPGCSAGNHGNSLVELWATTTGQESAAQALYDALDQGADEKKIQKIVAEYGREKSDYFFIESQINGLGYRFVQSQRPSEAVRLFRVNVELFPNSWNVYDSLGEALLALGDESEAKAMYEKSLELNPANENGKEVLAGLRGETVLN